jgi:hypothetical protein
VLQAFSTRCLKDILVGLPAVILKEGFILTQMLSFMDEHETHVRQQRSEAYARIGSALDGTQRSWCDPTRYREIVGVDFGRGSFWYYSLFSGTSGSGTYTQIKQVFTSFNPGTLIVVERAHLATPQTKKSLAQPMTGEELLDLYESCRKRDIFVKFFPHYHTRKCREWVAKNCSDLAVVAEKDSDLNDAICLAAYVANNNGVSLSNPPATFDVCQKRLFGKHVRVNANILLNAARVRGYRGQVFPAVLELARLIPKRLGVHCSFYSKPKGDEDNKAAWSIACLIINEDIDGNASRYVFKGSVPGKNFWMRNVLMFSSLHHRAGVARSNLLKHRFPAFLSEFAARQNVSTRMPRSEKGLYKPFSSFDKTQEQLRVECWRAVRLETKRAYDIACEYAEQQGFSDYEILDQEGNAHGTDAKP